MKLRSARWIVSLSTCMFFLSFLTVTAQAWVNGVNSVSGEAFGVSASVGPVAGVGPVVVPKTPDVVLPPDGGMVQNEVLSLSVPGTVASDTLQVITSGAIGASTASAQSSATVEQLNVLNGLVTAKLVVAMASSTGNGTTATSTAAGSTLVGLTVNGVSLGDITPAPNTTIDIPGVGSVILNEEIFAGDGVETTALTVNMIHVVLSGAVAGDIIVASAHSDVAFAPAPTPSPSPDAEFMTGGGRLGTGRAIATFGFNARPDLRGQLQYTDHAKGLDVHSTGLTDYASAGGSCVVFKGTARVNNRDGFHFRVTQACDNGEPGVGRDTFAISVDELSYDSTQSYSPVLTGGNLQLH
jgi:hypothetical protein